MAYTLLGKNFTPPDVHAKVTGAAKYAEDFRADGMVFLKTFPSPMPHARVKAIDVDAVKKMPGVVGVLLPSEIKQPKDAGHAILTNYPVFVGQPILAVAAKTEQQAEDAIQAVKVDLEPLPFVIDPLESLRPDGPNAHVGGNVANRRGVKLQQIKWSGKDFAQAGEDKLPMGKAVTEWSFGDVEAGFAKAKVVVEETFVSAANAHHAMEPRSAAAYWENGKVHVWGSTQSSSFAVPSLARFIGIKPTDINLVSEFCGGGFGGKGLSYPLMALPALMSKKLNGRPVHMRVSRADEFYNGSARAAFQGWVKIGFGADGRVLAIDCYIVQDNGSTGGFWDFQNFGMAASVILQPEAMRYRGIPVLTNTPPKGPQRGPGENQTANILEPILDKAARQLGIDRLAVRLANAPGGGPNGKIGPKRVPLTSAFLREGLEQAAAKWGYAERIKRAGKQPDGKIRAVGIGQAYHAAGYNGFDGMVRITPDGILHIHTGVGNLGTYSYGATSRVAAEVLGYDWNNTVIERGGTLKAMPFNIGQFGSNTSFTMTRTNYVAAVDARQKLLEIGAAMLGGKADDYELDKERVVAKNGSGSITFAQAAKKAIELGGKYAGHEVDPKLNPLTKAAVGMIKGTGLIGVAKDKLPQEGARPRPRRGVHRDRARPGDRQGRDCRLYRRRRCRPGAASAVAGRPDPRRRGDGVRPRGDGALHLRPGLCTAQRRGLPPGQAADLSRRAGADGLPRGRGSAGSAEPGRRQGRWRAGPGRGVVRLSERGLGCAGGPHVQPGPGGRGHDRQHGRETAAILQAVADEHPVTGGTEADQ